MKKKKKSYLKTIIVSIFLVGLVIFYFNSVSEKTSRNRNSSEKAELKALLEYNMELDYPNTPRDVVKLHNRYLKMLYGMKLTDDEIEGLGEKVRGIYCDELLALNNEEVSIDSLKENIKTMRDEEYIYKSYSLPEASQIQEFTRDGKEMAWMDVTVTIQTEDDMAYRYVRYIVIKENDKWKIYGWGDPK